jgi:DNA invertase Pin-like site-specific DNA recombinase
MAKKKVTAIYTRVSTNRQKDDSQQKALKDYIDQHGMGNVRWYRDKVSGNDLKRPDMVRLKADVFRGSIGTIIVWKLDRLARNMKDGIDLLCDWCERGVRVVSLQEQLDLGGTVGQIVASVLFGVAQMERENINERIRAGIAARRAKGLPMGRQEGQRFKWSTAKRKVDPELAKSLRSQGVKVTEIAERFGCSKQAIYDALKH